MGLEELLSHSAWVRRLAVGLTGDADADDLVQEAWIAAWLKPPRPGSGRGWLAAVLRNRARDRRKAEARRVDREQALAVTEDEGPSPDRLVEAVELQRTIAELVLALDQPLRTTLLLRYHDGLSAAELARRTGVPPGTVRWRLKTALDRLRAELDARHGGDRRRWALVLGAVAARRAPRPVIVFLAPVIALVVIVAAMALRPQGARPSERIGVSGGLPSMAGPSPGRAAAGAPSCEDRLAATEAKLAEVTALVDTHLPPQVHFRRNEPDGATRAKLDPLIANILARGRFDRSHALECRRGACRLEILTKPDDDRAYRPDLEHDPFLPEILGGRPVLVDHGATTTDPVSREVLKREAYLLPVKIVSRPRPATPRGPCATALPLVEQELAAARAELEWYAPNSVQYAHGGPSPQLIPVMDRLLTEHHLRIPHGRDARHEVLGCRGWVCRVALRYEPLGERRPFVQRSLEGLRDLVRVNAVPPPDRIALGLKGGPDVLSVLDIRLRDPQTADGFQFLEELRATLIERGVARDCRPLARGVGFDLALMVHRERDPTVSVQPRAGMWEDDISAARACVDKVMVPVLAARPVPLRISTGVVELWGDGAP